MRAYDVWIRCGAVRAGRGLTVGADGASKAGWGAMDEHLILRVSFCDFIYFAKP